MVYPNTGSTLTHTDGRNKTSTSSSTNIIIKVNDQAIGAVQNLSINEDRTITMIDEVGTDGHIDSLPTSSTNISGSCERIRFDRLRVAEAFSRGFVHAHSQVFPFDIVIYDTQNGEIDDDSSIITTVIRNVWIARISYAYNASNWIITDNMDWQAEHIFSYVGDSQSPVATGGERGLTPEGYTFVKGTGNTNVEQDADTAKDGRRGSFDVSNILNIAGNSGESTGGVIQ